jgi:hypothetical protein
MKFEAKAVEAGAASRGGSGSTEMMRLRFRNNDFTTVRVSVQNWKKH